MYLSIPVRVAEDFVNTLTLNLMCCFLSLYSVEYHNHKPAQEEHINEKLLAMGEIDLLDCEILNATELEHNVLLTLPVLESPGWLDNVSQDLQVSG